jgi:predicted tellurium resistance membrane protein TerC
MFDFSIFATADAWMSLLMLTFMEVILGIDNIIFITIVANKLAKEDQRKARNIGLFLAMLMRIVLLFGIFWIVKMSEPLFEINFLGLHGAFTGQSLILIGGGLFLMYKSTTEIHHKLEGASPEGQKEGKKGALGQIILQIVLLNIVFSFDSILTAVGLTDHLLVMILGVIISMIIMMLFAAPIGNFVNDRPTVQMLGLAFLILIGFMLIAEGAHQAHLIPGKEGEEVVPKGYIYFAIFFSLGVEMLNLRMRKKTDDPVQLHGPVEEAKGEGLI